MLFLAAALLRRRPRMRALCFGAAMATLLVCGNGWVVHRMVRGLEWQHLPPDPIPTADAILVLSGGIHAARPPRPTVEVSEAGDRVLYGGELFRRGRAPQIICTGDVGPGSIGRRPEAEDMADLLAMIGIPREKVMLETKAQNTHEHAVNLFRCFRKSRSDASCW